MKIGELQEYLKDRLNKVKALVQGGCKAFAEDTRTVYDESTQFISEGGVAVVVVTPELNRSGDGDDDGELSFEGDIRINCMERPPLAAENAGTIRALDAAEIVSHELDGEIFGWKSIRQTVTTDRDGNTVITATATFGYAGTLTQHRKGN